MDRIDVIALNHGTLSRHEHPSESYEMHNAAGPYTSASTWSPPPAVPDGAATAVATGTTLVSSWHILF